MRGNSALAVLMAAILCGCAVGPNFVPPPAPDVAGYTPAGQLSGAAGGRRFRVGRDIPKDWWSLFKSRPLARLVERAIANNPNLEAAQAGLRVAQANVAAGRGAFFPAIDGGFSAVRQKPPLSGPAVPDENGNLILPQSPTFNLFTGQVLVSYVPDVFGGIQRNVESLQAQSDNQRFQLEAAYLTLTSNIVLAVVQEASLRGQIAATKKLIQEATSARDELKEKKAEGKNDPNAPFALQTQEAALAQIKQTLPPLQRQLDQQRHLLSALTGDLPDTEPPETFDLGALHLPRDIPVSVPSQLVQQRPDLRAAEETLHAASAQIGVAIANRLPNLTLVAGVGSNAPVVEQLFSPGTGVWALSGAVVQPIFHGGTLFQHEVAARATFEQALSQYRSTVITAFQNVADSLSALKNDAEALKEAVASEKAANTLLQDMKSSDRAGRKIDYTLFFNAQQTALQARINHVQAQATLFADSVALFQALGGGWWNRDDIAPPKNYPLFSPFE
jgi:NodT family efflux transporter outer membrane factor (OMF) lipoprotein